MKSQNCEAPRFPQHTCAGARTPDRKSRFRFTRWNWFPTRALVCTAVVLSPLIVGGPTASGKPVSKDPGPVQVEGIVETLNDVLNQPYHRSATAFFSAGATSATVTFDVPSGKRLVVELVTLNAIFVPPGQLMVAFAYLKGDQEPRGLTLQSQGSFEGYHVHIGTHAIKLRLDGTAENDELSIVFHRSSTAQAIFPVNVSATVDGYLVDL